MYRPKPVLPRKVRGGVKLASESGAFPESWPAQRWMRLVERAAPGESLAEGLKYAVAGQTRKLSIDPGKIKGFVQGRVIGAYETTLTVPVFAADQAERAIGAMAAQAIHAAKLLAGELPPTVEDAIAPVGLKLFPSEPAELGTRCTCREPQPWCKHACCLAYLVAERFATDAFLVFTLRGLPREELLERLRQQRSLAGSGGGGALVYSPTVSGVTDAEARPLEECVADFWQTGPELETLSTPVTRPEVSHPLLRRLGSSPYAGPGKFPLVGLLATCYDLVSEATIRAEAGETVSAEMAETKESEEPAPEM